MCAHTLPYPNPTLRTPPQVLRFLHWAPEKAEFHASFRSGAGGAFACPAVVAAPSAGPAGRAVEVEVVFEPTAVGEDICDRLVLASPIAGALLGRARPAPQEMPRAFMHHGSSSAQPKAECSPTADRYSARIPAGYTRPS